MGILLVKKTGLSIRSIIIIVALLFGFIAFIVTKQHDSPIEQAAEAILKVNGVDIDFSPNDN